MSTAPATGPSGLDRRLLIALLAVGGVLVIGILVLILVLLTGGGGTSLADATTTPSASANTSATPSAAPSVTPTSGGDARQTAAPADTSTHFTEFDVVTTVHCDTTGDSPKPVVTLSWASENAVEAWFSPADVDAKDQGYMQVPTTGDQNDLTDEHLFDCNHRQTEDVTITLVGPNGEHVSKHATITDANWQG